MPRTALNETSLGEWLAVLETRHPKEIDLGLARVSEVAKKLGVDKPQVPVISVAGTNGKGSCIAVLESLLGADNCSVGSYTSPHLHHFNERIRVSTRPVDDALICEAFDRIEQFRGDISLTYFEFSTLAALWIFKEQAVEFILLEVGLGGRLDAVNIIDADVAVITSIDLDHQDWLGDDRESIGIEKAGIARTGKPLVCGDPMPPKTLLDSLNKMNADSIMLGSKNFNYTLHGQSLDLVCTGSEQVVSYEDLPLPILPLGSALSAVQALVSIGRTPSQPAVCQAFTQTTLKGRFQCSRLMGRDVILDVAHNPAAAHLLAKKLAAGNYGRIHGLFAVMADKDVKAIVTPLAAVIDHWHLCALPTVARAAKIEDISTVLNHEGLKAQIHDGVEEGLLSCLRQMTEGDVAVVFGSFHTVAQALALIDENMPQDMIAS